MPRHAAGGGGGGFGGLGGGGLGGFGGSMRLPIPGLSLVEAEELVTPACLRVGAIGVFLRNRFIASCVPIDMRISQIYQPRDF